MPPSLSYRATATRLAVLVLAVGFLACRRDIAAPPAPPPPSPPEATATGPTVDAAAELTPADPSALPEPAALPPEEQLVPAAMGSAPSAPESEIAPTVAPEPPAVAAAQPDGVKAPEPEHASPPAPPRDLVASPTGAAAELSWTGVAGGARASGYEVFRGEERIARVTESHARDEGLRAGNRYCYTVVALDAAGNRSSASEPACLVAPDVTPPSAPAALSATLSSPTEVELRWPAATDDVRVTAYEVLRGEQLVASTRDLVARVSAPPPARRACYAVRAVDGAGNRSVGSTPACVTAPDVTPPTAPSQLTAQGRAGAVELRWSPSTDDVGVTAYEVVRNGAVVSKNAKTVAVETGLRAIQQYCYMVRALDAAGNASPFVGPACAVPPDVTPPSIPGRPMAHADRETSVSLRWGAAVDDVGVARYEVIRDGFVVATATSLQTEVGSLRPAVKYCHTVRACDAAGNCSAPSAPACATTPDLTPPKPVAHVSAQAASDRRIDVRWTATTDNVGVARYELHDGDRVLFAGADATSYSDASVSPATRHCYVVIALDAAGNRSARSPEACATTPDLTPPSVPPEVVTAPQSGSQVVVAWGPATDDVGVTGYEVLRDGAVVATVQRRQASMGRLAPETEYCFSVRAFDAAGNRSTPSKPACGRTASSSTVAAPWNLRAQTTKRQELLLSWERSSTPGVLYAVYWDGRRGERRVATTPAPTFKVFGAAAKERHCYRVTAIDEAAERESPKSIPLCGGLGGAAAAGPDVAAGAPDGGEEEEEEAAASAGAGSGGAP